MIRLLASVLALLLLAACQPGNTGVLQPIISGEVMQAQDSDAAVVRAAGVSATVSGQWASEASQSATIVYLNKSKAPASIALPALVLHHRLGDATLWSVSDLTEIDRNDDRKDNDDPPVIYDDADTNARSRHLVLKPGEQRDLSVGFTNFPGTERIRAGDRVTMTVPLGNENAEIKFEAK